MAYQIHGYAKQIFLHATSGMCAVGLLSVFWTLVWLK